MAFYDEEDEDNVGTSGQSVSAQGGMIGGGGGAPSGPGGGTTPAAAKPTNPGNFVNLSTYLDRNKPQAQRLADNVGGFIESKNQDFTNKLGAASQKFDTDAKAGTVGYNQGLVDQVKQNPVGVSNESGQSAAFNKMYNASYGGPGDFDAYDDEAQKAREEATRLGKDALSGEVGQKNVLRSMQKNVGRMNQGALNLDQALLQTEGGTAAINKAVQGQSGFDKSVSDAFARAAAAANQGKATSDETRAKTQGEFTGVNSIQNNLINQAKQKADQERAAYQTKIDNAKGGLQNATSMNKMQQNYLGVSDQDYGTYQQKVADIEAMNKNLRANGLEEIAAPSLASYMRYNDPNQITAESVMSKDDAARIGALNKLMGIKDTAYTDTARVGTYTPGSIGLDIGEATQSMSEALTGGSNALFNIPKPTPEYAPDNGFIFNQGPVPQEAMIAPTQIGGGMQPLSAYEQEVMREVTAPPSHKTWGQILKEGIAKRAAQGTVPFTAGQANITPNTSNAPVIRANPAPASNFVLDPTIDPMTGLPYR